MTTASCANRPAGRATPWLSELLCPVLISHPPGPGEGRRASFSVPWLPWLPRAEGMGSRRGLWSGSHSARVSCVTSVRAFNLSGPWDIPELSRGPEVVRGLGAGRGFVSLVFGKLGGSRPGCGDIPDHEQGVDWGSPSVARSAPVCEGVGSSALVPSHRGY